MTFIGQDNDSHVQAKSRRLQEDDAQEQLLRGPLQRHKGLEGIAIANDGNLLVMEDNEGRNGRMLKVDLKTKEMFVLADGLGVDRSYAPPTTFGHLRPHSVVAQASDGAIYFTEVGTLSFSVLRAQS